MGVPITRPALAQAIDSAVRAAAELPLAQRAAMTAALVLDEPVVANATTPLPRARSEVLQGVAGIGVAQLLNAFGVTETLVIAAGWFGRSWDPAEVSTALTTVVSLMLAAWSWYGRETTSRPLR